MARYNPQEIESKYKPEFFEFKISFNSQSFRTLHFSTYGVTIYE